MRTTLLLSVLLSARLIVTATAAPALSDGSGQWLCLPEDWRNPQVQIDFDERVYRRCDQHTCSTFDLTPIQRDGDVVVFTFGETGEMRAAPDGTRYVETVMVGGEIISSRGSCSFRDLDELYLEDAETARS